MSSLPRVRRRKRTRSSRLRARHPSIEVVGDVAPQEAPAPAAEPTACIDLTCADDDIVVTSSTLPVVDLTNIIDSPIVIGTPDSPVRRRHRRTHWPTNSDSDTDELQELPPVPFFVPDRPSESSTADVTASGGATAGNAASAEKGVTCPVCLDTSQEIRSSGRQLFSTTCGHVFCNQCINDSIKTQKRCPSCRKKLTSRQIHPLFI